MPLMPMPAMANPAGPSGFATLDEAYRAHAEDVGRWAWQLGGPAVDVEDVVQEVFLVVSRQLPRFRGDARFTSWLFAITRKITANHRRRQRWRFWTARSEPALLLASSVAPDPGAALERKQTIARFYAALDALTEKYRTILVLFELEGLSTQAIAEVTNQKANTVRVQLLRARQQFLDRYQRLLKKGKS